MNEQQVPQVPGEEEEEGEEQQQPLSPWVTDDEDELRVTSPRRRQRIRPIPRKQGLQVWVAGWQLTLRRNDFKDVVFCIVIVLALWIVKTLVGALPKAAAQGAETDNYFLAWDCSHPREITDIGIGEDRENPNCKDTTPIKTQKKV